VLSTGIPKRRRGLHRPFPSSALAWRPLSLRQSVLAEIVGSSACPVPAECERIGHLCSACWPIGAYVCLLGQIDRAQSLRGPVNFDSLLPSLDPSPLSKRVVGVVWNYPDRPALRNPSRKCCSSSADLNAPRALNRPIAKVGCRRLNMAASSRASARRPNWA
jgi:hypothetical protein